MTNSESAATSPTSSPIANAGIQPIIEIDSIQLTHSMKNVEAVRREVGMVFQQFNLFPHLTVTPDQFFNNSKSERTRKFLSQILH